MNKVLLTAVAAFALVIGGSAASQAGEHPVGGGKLAKTNPCHEGYQYYPKTGTCEENHTDHPIFVEKAKCTPGETRKIPDPKRPGGFRIQTCNYVAD